jgi:hypothetical protein
MGPVRSARAPRASAQGSGSVRTRAARWKTVLVQLVVFACVGGVFNLFYGLLYVLLRAKLSAQPANAIALVLSTTGASPSASVAWSGPRATRRWAWSCWASASP